MRQNYIFVLSFLLLVLSSCSSSSFIPEEHNFPLVKSKSIDLNEDIGTIAVSDSFLVFETPNTLQAVDINTDKTLWALNDFNLDPESEIMFSNDVTIIMLHNDVLLVDSKGNQIFLDLNRELSQNIDLIAVYKNFVYIIRGGGWTLEVYDISKNKLLWGTSTGRGGTQVFYDNSKDVVYVTNVSSIRAFNNGAGELLWQYDIRIDESAYYNDVLYICETLFDDKTYQVTAFEVKSQKVLWEYESASSLGMYVQKCSVFKDTLIINTSTGLYLMDIRDGKSVRHILGSYGFYQSPVSFNDITYVKGLNKAVYAISLESDNVEGYVQLEPSPVLGAPSEDFKVFLYKDGIIFKAKNEIVFYAPK